MRIAALLAVAVLALAGCSGKSDSNTYTCQKTGQVVDLSKVAGSDAKGFDPESACAPPTPPSVTFDAPSSMVAYFPSVASWSVSPGNYTQGHSMSTQLRSSTKSIDAGQLTKPEDYGTLVQQFSHQDLPGKFDAKLKFSVPGTYYLRAYAQVRGEGLPDTDYWSPEVTLVVKPVQPSGKTITLTHEQGPGVAGQVGKFGPAANPAALGDQVVLANGDLTQHTFTFTGACKHDPVQVAAGASSDPILMAVPGSCNVVSDDATGTQQAAVNVSEPI